MSLICLSWGLFFMLISTLLFVSSMFFMIEEISYFVELVIFSVNSSSIVMTLLFDWMSLLFMSFVLFISSMVVMYSDGYMEGDLNLVRFIILICFFVFSMMLMIISPNLISILLGWDGLGLVSYCLIVYYQNVKSSSAGMLTSLSNRIGDVAILLAISWMLNYGSFNFLYYLDFMKGDFSMVLVSSLVVLAAMTKSAQIPFSSWLPAAMAAPTPVSSLVHSSTLVTAGVYLMIRFYSAFSSSLIMFILLVSCLTMFMAGAGANYEYDFKKIIALSTLSQLGLMMATISIGETRIAFFHLLTHALFKALLFMCAGNFIHNVGNFQDIRFMGSLCEFMPLTCVMFNLSNMALCGLPFLAGFYSKDLILEILNLNGLSVFIYLMFFISTGLTVSYSVRLFFYSVLGNFNYLSFFNLSDSSNNMLFSMMGMFIFVILGGSVLSWLVLPVCYMICLPYTLKLLTLIVIFLGIFLGFLMFSIRMGEFNFMLSSIFVSLFFSSMWNMPFLSTFLVSKPFLLSGSLYYKAIDQGWLESLGGQNLYSILSKSSFKVIYLNNNLKVYMSILLLWVVFIFLFI
uniref:NADH-ubiquinone oxidoreductase chain 5 n=1 Tax=Coraebus cavifrons TaxID=2823020 RepID=A0A8A6W4D6_9COLE|nr:NADH dehydrogenase subunit 5 [Coraebus cavifrons]QTK22430.1 NADH dehydrogenase subunit 5 [Coraebus cavifrons]